jgi:hypothetical protein
MNGFGKSICARVISVLIVMCLMAGSFASAANARYISPDNWDPSKPGVGTNRYAYSENDPINKSDPNGHQDYGMSQEDSDALHAKNAAEFDRMAKEQRDKYDDAYDLAKTYDKMARDERSRIGKTSLERLRSDDAKTLESVLGALGIGLGMRATAAVKSAVAADEGVNAANFSRNLTAADLGVKGTVSELKGTISVKDGVATVTVDMIRADIKNPLGVMKNLADLAKANGATTLRVEGSLANEKLAGALAGRYGVTTSGAVDTITISVK